MGWTNPKLWLNYEPLTAGDMNLHITDNLMALKYPPTVQVELDEPANYSTISLAWAYVDTTRLSLTLVTGGGDILIGFYGTTGSSGVTLFDLDVDGVRAAGDDGMLAVPAGNMPVSFVRLQTGVTPGQHVIRLMWRVVSNSGILYAGAGTTNYNSHPQFWAREVS
jgi:hypothetical protein